jgi:hypothetical protein
MVKNTGKIGKYGFFTNLALFYDDVSMTSLVGHGDVTSADVIGRTWQRVTGQRGGEVAAQSAVSWTYTEAGTSGRGRGSGSAVNGRKSNRSGHGYSLNRRGFSGRFEYGAEGVRRSSEMV